ncbi:putative membrane protein [Streptacidiphilus sp. MAP12-33]|uniref:DUF2254 family protein n=1 Tax=Streptacidiphilus sp. MAP12-33 TaxID=3156266 RepID=UPI003518244A
MEAPPIGPFGPRQPAERVVRPRRRLRAGVTQGFGLVVGVTLGLTLPRIDGGARVSASRTVEVLGVVGIAVLGVTSLIFSLLFLVAQWVAGNFSPRLSLFRSDPVVWRVFAFVIGLLAFAVSATLTIGSRATVPLVVPLLTGVGTVVALALVRTLQLRAFGAIQLAQVLAGTAARGHAVLDAFYPRSDADVRPAPGPLPPVRSTVAWPVATRVIEQVDVRAMVASARGAGATVVLRVPVGGTVHRGDPVADVRGGAMTDDQVLRNLIPGPERSFHQDPLHAFRLLADIGLRALSPAVNDPATAVQALDGIDSLLRRLVGARLDAASVPDESGEVRVVLLLPAWSDFLRTGLDDMCRAALDSPMVLAHATRVLRGLLTSAPPERREPLRERLAWVEQELRVRHPPFMSLGPG